MSWLRVDVTTAGVLAGILLVAAAGLRPFRRRWSGWAAAAAFETALVSALFALWQLANAKTHTHQDGGLANGRAIWHLEGTLHIRTEAWFQHLILDQSWLVRASNYYYATAHLTGMFIFLVWLWLRHRDRYAQWRNVMVGFTGISLLIQMVPVAPPRLIGGTGLEDTAKVYGQSVYDYVGSNMAHQYAAMPSIHAGWAILIAIACYRCSTSRLRWIGVAHGVITLYIIVATANHYWMDSIAAAGILAFAYAAERGLASLPWFRSSTLPALCAHSDLPEPHTSSRSAAFASATARRS